MTMSENDKLSKLENEMAFIKRWWPVVGAIFVCAGLLVKGTNFVDTNVATKKDISELRTDIAEIKKIINITKNTDTVYRITINNKVDELAKEIKWVEHSRGFVTEHKTSPTSNPTFSKVN